MLKVYKPKGDRVKADQITMDTVVDLSKMFMGRLTSEPVSGPKGKTTVTGFEYPTFEGAKNAILGQWVIQLADGQLKTMEDSEFHSTYELARNTLDR